MTVHNEILIRITLSLHLDSSSREGTCVLSKDNPIAPWIPCAPHIGPARGEEPLICRRLTSHKAGMVMA